MRSMYLKKNNGFTLVEVIVSIAVLSLICVIVLKLFVLANDVSKKSRIEDVASIYAMNVIEICKQVDIPSEAFIHPFLQSAQVKYEENLNIEGLMYFNQNWETIHKEVTTEDSIFALQLHIAKRQDESLSSKDGALFDIEVAILQKNFETGEYEQIIEYITSNYYIYNEE